MKVSNLDLLPNRTFRYRNLGLDPHSAMRALIHRGTAEAVLVTENAVKIHPTPITLQSWAELVKYPDPEEVIPKKVSGWSWLSGDNPFLIITSAGNPFPFPDNPETNLSYEEARTIYVEAVQAALHSKGIASAMQQGMGAIIQGILAGVCVLGAILVAAGLLPRILDRF